LSHRRNPGDRFNSITDRDAFHVCRQPGPTTTEPESTVDLVSLA
jgi:hypothetical protein